MKIEKSRRVVQSCPVSLDLKNVGYTTVCKKLSQSNSRVLEITTCFELDFGIFSQLCLYACFFSMFHNFKHVQPILVIADTLRAFTRCPESIKVVAIWGFENVKILLSLQCITTAFSAKITMQFLSVSAVYNIICFDTHCKYQYKSKLKTNFQLNFEKLVIPYKSNII